MTDLNKTDVSCLRDRAAHCLRTALACNRRAGTPWSLLCRDRAEWRQLAASFFGHYVRWSNLADELEAAS